MDPLMPYHSSETPSHVQRTISVLMSNATVHKAFLFVQLLARMLRILSFLTQTKVYIYDQAEKWGKRLTPKYVDELVNRVMEPHSKTH